MVAAELPMYDLPELHLATDAWWSGIARALRREGIEHVPDRLTREQPIEGRLKLLVSQVCGSNMTGDAREKFAYVATPCYSAPGCGGPLYRSVIVVSASCPAQTLEELRGSRCAINSYKSHSGCNSLRASLAPLAKGGRFFTSVTVSGSHALSLALIASGQADVAAIDCITYALLGRYRPRVLEDTRTIALTPAAPVGPYVTRASASNDLIARLRSGLAQAVHDSGFAAARADLLLDGFEILPVENYERITQFEVEAKELGYRDFDLQNGT